MALKSTIYKINLSVSDLNRDHYKDYSLTTAKHPSETDERLACRIIDDLIFAKGLSDDKEPDLWQKSLDGRILKWIEIGHPDEKKLRRLSGRSESIEIYCYQLGVAQVWWKGIEKQALKLPKLKVSFLNVIDKAEISAIIDRTMDLNCVIEGSSIAVSSNSNDNICLNLELQQIK
jgi:uncharacterized protein YaeQ